MLALSRNLYPAYQSLVRRPLGPQVLHGHATGRQDAGDRRAGPHRPGRGQAGPGPGDEGPGLRSVPLRRSGPRNWESRPSARSSEMLPQVDYLTVHTPLNDETRNLIGGRRDPADEEGRAADQLRPRRHLQRGGAGRRAQERAFGRRGPGRVSRASPAPTARCSACPTCSARPHLGASTEEAQSNVALEAAELLVDFFTTGAIRQSVNMSPLDPKTLEASARLSQRRLPAGLAAGPGATRPARLLQAPLQGRGGQEGHPAAVGRFRRRAAGTRHGADGEHRQRRGPPAGAGDRAGRGAQQPTSATSAR